MKRRRILKGIAASTLVPILGACGDEVPGSQSEVRYPTTFGTIPPLSGIASTAEVLLPLLEELRQSYEAIGERVTATLEAPISPTELVSSCRWFPGTLPEELLALYSWRGGQNVEKDAAAAPFWFRDVIFSTPKRAEDEYKSMMSSYGQMLPASTIGVELKYCFPFAAFNGGWYVFPCNGQAIDHVHPRAIISVFEGIDVYFHSFEMMLRTCIDWVKDPSYRKLSNDSGDIEMKIWQKYNPGVFDR